jgi:hypothetical protein
MTLKRWLIFVTVLLACMLTVWPADAQAGPLSGDVATPITQSAAPVYPPGWNLLLNAGFETGDTAPDDWAKFAWVDGAKFRWDAGVAHEGGRSVKIVIDAANDARWFQRVGVMENTDYVLSGWIKTQDVAPTSQIVDAGANLSVESDIPGRGFYTQTPALLGTNDWTYVSVVFNTGANAEIQIDARLGMFNGITTGTAWFDDFRLVPLRRLYLSSSRSGEVAGISFTPGDILTHTPDTGEWAMYFDASDVGIFRNVAAFGLTEEGTILMSLSATQWVAGAGNVRPRDVIMFQATSTGPDTAGSFSLFLNSRDAGLTTASEKIDALTWRSGWYMDVSTTGALGVKAWDGTSIRARDEDMTEAWMYYGYFDGWETITFDGSAVPGLASEDVTAAYFDAWSWCWFLTIQGSGVIDGHAYTQKDIFMVQEGTLLGRFWNGPASGFNYPIDGIDITEW